MHCNKRRAGVAIIYSITSSARPSSEIGKVMPRALAVLRLRTNSNLVGCSTGRSAGLAPFRILERFLEQGALGRLIGGDLNYFPDPYAIKIAFTLMETLDLTTPVGLSLSNETSNTVPIKLSTSNKPSLFLRKEDWPTKGTTPKIDLTAGVMDLRINGQNAAISVPAARVALCRIVAEDPRSPSVADPKTGLTVRLLHASTGPLRQPEWGELIDDPSRKPNDTAQNFRGYVGADLPSSGSVMFMLFWNDLWDESVPALFGEAKVVAHAPDGSISKIFIKEPGFGYGSQAVVPSIGASTGSGAVLVPVVKDGKLTAVSIENGGAGYPKNADIPIKVVRRPPLHKPRKRKSLAARLSMSRWRRALRRMVITLGLP
jgi:hypothetical protein